MTEPEVKDFLRTIKAHYQEFAINDAFTMKTWIENLMPYSKNDIYEKFNEHLENESVQKEVPKMQVLTKWLIPEREKNRKVGPIKGYVYCRWCGSKFKNTEYLIYHEETCLRQRYIARMCDKLEIKPDDIFGKSIYQCSLEELNNNYDKFILKIIEIENQKKVLNSQEKAGIKAYYQNVIRKG